MDCNTVCTTVMMQQREIVNRLYPVLKGADPDEPGPLLMLRFSLHHLHTTPSLCLIAVVGKGWLSSKTYKACWVSITTGSSLSVPSG